MWRGEGLTIEKYHEIKAVQRFPDNKFASEEDAALYSTMVLHIGFAARHVYLSIQKAPRIIRGAFSVPASWRRI